MKRNRISIINNYKKLKSNIWQCHADLFNDYNKKCISELEESSYFDDKELVRLTQSLKESKKILIDYSNENKELIDEYNKIEDMLNRKDLLNSDELIYIINSEFVIKSHVSNNIKYGTFSRLEILMFNRVLYTFDVKDGRNEIEDTIINKFKKNEHINRYK